MLAAQGHVTGLVRRDLVAFAQRRAGRVGAQIHGRLAPAIADRAHLAKIIGQRQQRRGAVEQLALEVGAQPLAQDRRVQIVADPGELIDLGSGEELGPRR